MEEYFQDIGLISSQKDQNGSWKDGIEFPAPNIHGLRNKKRNTPEQDSTPENTCEEQE